MHEHKSNPANYYSHKVDVVDIHEEAVSMVGRKGGRATTIVQVTKELNVLETDALTDHKRVT